MHFFSTKICKVTFLTTTHFNLKIEVSFSQLNRRGSSNLENLEAAFFIRQPNFDLHF